MDKGMNYIYLITSSINEEIICMFRILSFTDEDIR